MHTVHELAAQGMYVARRCQRHDLPNPPSWMRSRIRFGARWVPEDHLLNCNPAL